MPVSTQYHTMRLMCLFGRIVQGSCEVYAKYGIQSSRHGTYHKHTHNDYHKMEEVNYASVTDVQKISLQNKNTVIFLTTYFTLPS